MRAKPPGRAGDKATLGMKILITGNLGYVGPSVVRFLRRAHPGARIVGYDSAFFALP